MTYHALTEVEKQYGIEASHRAATLRALIELNNSVCTQLEVLGVFLKAGRGQPNMLYALALTSDIYETLTGFPLPEATEELSHEQIEQFREIAKKHLGV